MAHTPGTLKAPVSKSWPASAAIPAWTWWNLSVEDGLLSTIGTARRAEDAARFVLCWNCHDDLLAACKAARERLAAWQPIDKTETDQVINKQLDAAIARATGGKP